LISLQKGIFKGIWELSNCESSHIKALNFYPIFFPLDEGKVSGVSVQRSRWPEKRPV